MFQLGNIATTVLALGLVLASISTAMASQQSEPSKEELEATIAALQTQVAGMDSQESGEAVGTPSPSGSWNIATAAGNGFEVLTPAPAGTVEVIARGVYDGQRLPFVIHNNTETAVDSVSVEASVLDGAGGLFAVAGDLGINPGWIEPGAIGLGYLYFDGIAFPPGATVEMSLSYDAEDSRGTLSSLEAAIAEWNLVDNRIVGFLANPHSVEIIEPIEVSVACLAVDGAITSYHSEYAQSAAIPVGGQIPFQVTIDAPACEYVLIVADGFNW